MVCSDAFIIEEIININLKLLVFVCFKLIIFIFTWHKNNIMTFRHRYFFILEKSVRNGIMLLMYNPSWRRCGHLYLNAVTFCRNLDKVNCYCCFELTMDLIPLNGILSPDSPISVVLIEIIAFTDAHRKFAQ